MRTKYSHQILYTDAYIILMVIATYISDNTSNKATPSLRSSMESGGLPESVGKVPMKSTIAANLSSSPILTKNRVNYTRTVDNVTSFFDVRLASSNFDNRMRPATLKKSEQQ